MPDSLVKILIVEDDEDDYILTKDILSEIDSANFKIKWQSDFVQALEILQDGDYDVALVDFYMGSFTGLEFILMARARECKTPVILLTGQGDRETIIDSMKAGATDYLSKDQLTPLVLGKSINYALDKHKRQIEREKLQGELERARRMESIGILAGGVAHDLNNMLGPLVAYPELIKEKLSRNKDVSDELDVMAYAANQAANVVMDMLTLSRRGRHEMEPTSMVEVVNKYIASASFLDLKERYPKVKVILRLDESIPNIMGSVTHLSKIIMNLIGNAFEAIPGEGSIFVEVRKEFVEKLLKGDKQIESGNYVVLRVRDTGTGISEKDIDNIFEPYYSKKQMGRSGSGLGLAIVYGVIKDHQGYYDVVSEVSKGTEFILYFPVTREEAKSKKMPEMNLRGSEMILFVDDDANQRDVVESLLAQMGYTVFSVPDGESAVQFLSGNEVNLVILDMIFENGQNGAGIFKSLKAIRPDQKVMICSGFSSTDEVRTMQEQGAGQFLMKPFTLEKLSRAVREELDHTLIKTMQKQETAS